MKNSRRTSTDRAISISGRCVSLAGMSTLLLFSLTSGCASSGGASQADSLVGTIWLADEISGVAAMPGDQPTLQFVDEAGKVSGSGACNSFFGTATIDGGQLSFSNLGATMKACSPELLDQETQYMQALGETQSYTLGGSTLSLHDAAGGTVIVYSLLFGP